MISREEDIVDIMVKVAGWMLSILIGALSVVGFGLLCRLLRELFVAGWQIV